MPEDKANTIRVSTEANLIAVLEKADADAVELEALTEEAKGAVNGKVHVSDTAYGGVRISIASATLKINDSIVFATFKYKEGEVVYSACEQGSRRR